MIFFSLKLLGIQQLFPITMNLKRKTNPMMTDGKMVTSNKKK